MTLTPEWLKYGAFGLLALVLVVLGYLTRDFFNHFMERQKVRENHAAEVNLTETQGMMERLERQDDFTRQLIAQDRVDRNLQAKSFADLVANDIKAKQEMTDAMRGMVDAMKVLCESQEAHDKRDCRRQELHEKQTSERHIGLIEALGQLRT